MKHNLAAIIIGALLVYVVSAYAQEALNPEQPNPPEEIATPYPVMCFNSETGKWERVDSDCNPVNDPNCPIPCAAYGGAEVEKGLRSEDIFHEDGQLWKNHYCACYETVTQLWFALFQEDFPYDRPISCY